MPAWLNELILRATIILSISGYLWTVWPWLIGGPARSRRGASQIWALSCGLCWCHVLFALLVIDGGDFAKAEARVAEQTAALIGIRNGIGIYANFGFLLLWTFDACGWLNWGGTRLRIFVHSYLAFLTLQATVVFGPWYWRPMGLLVALFVVWARRSDRKKRLIT